jgi:hypothetical protein
MINANKTAMKLLIGQHHSEASAGARFGDRADALDDAEAQAERKR